MDTKIFLQSVLGSEGFYCVWGFKGDRLVTKFYDSIDKVIDTATKLDNNGYNAFFALATFEKSGSRKVENAKQYKSFFFDLDCGDKKDYPSQLEDKDLQIDSKQACVQALLPESIPHLFLKNREIKMVND